MKESWVRGAYSAVKELLSVEVTWYISRQLNVIFQASSSSSKADCSARSRMDFVKMSEAFPQMSVISLILGERMFRWQH